MDLQFVFGNPIKKDSKVKKKSVAKNKKVKKNKKVNKVTKEEDLVAKKKKKATKKTKKVVRKATKKSSAKKSRKTRKTRKVSAKKVKRASKKRTKSSKSKIYKGRSKKASKRLALKANPRRSRKGKRKGKGGSKANVKVTLSAKSSVSGKRKSISVKMPRSSFIKKAELKKTGLQEALYMTKKVKKTKAARKKLGRGIKSVAKAIKKAKNKRFIGKAKLNSYRSAMRADGVKRIKTIKKFTNPFGGAMINIQKYLGHDVKEIAGLAAGGAIYGAVNGVTAKYAKPVHDILVKVPVVGTALPSLLAGVALMVLADKVKAAAPAAILGRGLIGASVVGMGVNASQLVPQLNTLKGLGTADFGALQHEASLMGPDFGKADFGNAGQMGGIDYSMSGVDTYAGIDYSMAGDDDYAGVPEGMGQGQMG